MKFVSRILTLIMFGGIRFYQKFINPMLKAIGGPNTGCRFSPTCSNYFLQAVQRHGPYRGAWLGICRIFRCHPWGKCGHDPVPPVKNSPSPKDDPAPPQD